MSKPKPTLSPTGRARQQPNLQGLPVKTDDGRKIREAFIGEQVSLADIGRVRFPVIKASRDNCPWKCPADYPHCLCANPADPFAVRQSRLSAVMKDTEVTSVVNSKQIVAKQKRQRRPAPKMKLWLLKPVIGPHATVSVQSAIVAATSAAKARAIHPSDYCDDGLCIYPRWPSDNDIWVVSPDEVDATYLGLARRGIKTSVLMYTME